MPAPDPFDVWNRRLAAYGYLAPLLEGRRVLEVGCGEGIGAARLRDLGAASVLGVDTNSQALARARADHGIDGLAFAALEKRTFEPEPSRNFDLIVIPDGAGLLKASVPPTLDTWRGLLGPEGRIVLLVTSGDRAGAPSGTPGYYEIVEALEPAFGSVRMFGVTPFAAFGVAEFGEATTSGLRIDGGLVDESSEQPTHYLAIAGGADERIELGYALVQTPVSAPSAPAPAAPVVAPALADNPDQRRRLAEAEGQVEGLLRVSRAQTDEIEELRARLRRGAESRSELDQEVTRLRRSLAEADESVLDLTRRTTQEMAALAQRITAGLRPDETGAEAPSAQKLREQLRRRDEELAARESALSERDDRIVALEADRQDLQWQLDAAASREAPSTPAPSPVSAAPIEAIGGRDQARDQAIDQYRQAAAAHLAELNHLREALAEQSTLVSELEDSLAASGGRLKAAEEEAERLRRHVTEVEQADRARRSRLAEVEGTLLRLQRQTALAAQQAQPANDGAGTEAAERRAREAEQKLAVRTHELDVLEGRLREVEAERAELERRWADATGRLVGVERALAEREATPASNPDDQAKLESALRELGRVREAFERSEEQLWETKGQLLLDRERMAVLEEQAQTAAEAAAAEAVSRVPTVSEAAHQAILNAVLKELSDIETGVRAESARLGALERQIESWRAQPGSAEPSNDVPLRRAE